MQKSHWTIVLNFGLLLRLFFAAINLHQSVALQQA